MSHSMPEKIRMPRLPIFVKPPDAGGELRHPAFVKPVRHGERLRMIGDGDVLVAALPRCFRHFFKRGAPVGLGGMHVEIAANLIEFDQFGHDAFGGQFYLAEILADFRRDPTETERLVYAFFSLASYFDIVFDAVEAIFA